MRSAPDPDRLLFILTVALPLFAIWGVAFPPLLDFPEHALIAHVVARGSYDAGPEYHGSLHLHSLWVPYGMFYFLAVPVVWLGSAILATKLWLSVAVLGTAMALRWLLAVLGRSRYAFYFGFPFLFSFAYLIGLVPYVLGIPFLILAVTLLMREPETTVRNFLPRLAVMMAMVWAHPLVYAAAAAVLAVAALVLHRRSPRQLALAALWIGLPAIYLLAWGSSLAAQHGVSWRNKAFLLQRFFSNLGAYDTPSPDRLFLLPKLPLLLWFVWACFALRQRDSWTRQDKALGAGVGLLLLLVAALPEFYGDHIVGGSFRFTPIAAVLGAALLPNRVTQPATGRALLLAWCFAVLGSHLVLALRFDREMNGFVSLARRMEPRQTVVQRYAGPENVLYSHALSYYLMAKGGVSPQPLLTLTWSRIFPARLSPPFPWHEADWIANDPLTHPEGRVFRYVLVRTSQKKDLPPPAPTQPNHSLVASAGGWLLYERR